MPQQGQVISNWSRFYGQQKGQLFQFSNPDYSLVAVKGRFGALIDQIQFVFQNIHSQEYVESPPYGGYGGGQFLFRVPQGQWIDRIFLKVTKEKVLIAIELQTNQGIKSGKRGGDQEGEQVQINAKGNRITGVRCMASIYVNGLSFNLAISEE